MYQDTVRAAVRQHHGLEVFLYSFERPPEEQIKGLPSWVPLWFSSGTRNFITADCDAGKGFPQHFCDEDTDPSILTLAGFILGELKAHYQPGGTGSDRNYRTPLRAQDYKVYFDVAAALTRQWVPSDESMSDHLGRTLLGRCISDYSTIKRSDADIIASFKTGDRRVLGQQAHSLKESPFDRGWWPH